MATAKQREGENEGRDVGEGIYVLKKRTVNGNWAGPASFNFTESWGGRKRRLGGKA